MYQSTFDKLTTSKNFENIVYWIETWEDLFNNIDNYYGLELENPHLILIDIKNEIRLNKLKNKKNASFFRKKISKFIKYDPVIREDYKSDFLLINKELETKRPEFFLELCNAILQDFKNGKYFYKTLENLEKTLKKTTWSDSDSKLIYYLSQNLIVEFILKGYSLKNIRSFPDNIFDDYNINDRKYIATHFPHGIDINDYKEGDTWDYASYSKVVSEKIQQLSIEDRISSLKNYYLEKPDQGFFIFQIEGLIGHNEMNIGNVCFYSPLQKKYIVNESLPLEFFDNKKPMFVNAAIKLSYIDVENAKNVAIERINSALDVIKLFHPQNDPIVINKYNFLISDDNKNVRQQSSSISPKDSAYHLMHSVDMDEFNLRSLTETDLENIIKNISSIQLTDDNSENVFINKIFYSLHWYRKALESTIPEDKLLNFWIVLESLVTFENRTDSLVFIDEENGESKIGILEDTITAIEIDHLISRIGIDLFTSLYREINSFSVPPKKGIIFSPKTIDACHLRKEKGTSIPLDDFIQNIPMAVNEVESAVYKNKIEEVIKFYNDRKIAQKIILKQIRKIKDDLLLIYRLRNFIVHNANFDNYLLQYYTEKASIYSGNLLREIINQYLQNPNKSHVEIILERKVKLKRLIEKLDENKLSKIAEIQKLL